MKKIPFIFYCFFLFSTILLAAEKRGMEVDDLFHVRRAGNPQVSPDGQWIVYTISMPQLDKNQTVTHLYRVSFTGRDTLQLTMGQKSEWNPQWHPDSRKIGFLSNRSSSNQVWLMNPFHGEAGQLTDMKTGVQDWIWSNDGTRIAFTSQDSLTKKEAEKRKSGDDEVVVDEDLRMFHLYVIDLNTRQVNRLTRGSFTVANPKWSPDDQFIYFEKRPTPKADDRWKSDIMMVASDSGAVREVAATPNAESNPLPSPDGQWLAFSSSPGPGQWIGNAVLCLVSSLGGEPHFISESFAGSVYSICWSPDSRFIYFNANIGVASNLFRIDIYSKITENISKDDDVLHDFSFDRNCNRTAFTLQRPDQPPEIYSTEMDIFAPRHLTFSNRWLDTIQLGAVKSIHWKSYDGEEIEGLLVTPIHYQEGEPVPTIVRIHGGPAGVYNRSFLGNWGNYAHVLAAQGYATFMPNFRGSSAYGEEFQRADIRDWGIGDYQDIMTGVDTLIQMGIADPQKLGVAGWSYGGYMTFWTITQTDRFKVAAAGAGLTNIFSMYSENDIPSTLDAYFEAEPWNDTTEYQRASPINYVANVSTPLLILQGEADPRVPKYQSMEFYEALKQMDKPVKMILFPRQGHGIGELNLQKGKIVHELAWFNKYIKQLPPQPTQNKLTAAAIISLHSIQSPKISPDGKTVLFSLSQLNADSSRNISHIYRLDLDSGNGILHESQQLTHSQQGESAPKWSPDGSQFAFLSFQDSSMQIYRMNPFHGEAGKITYVKNGVERFQWSPDGKQIAFTTMDTLSKEEESKRKSGNDVKVWQETKQKTHLWIADVESGAARKLTAGEFNVLEFAWSPTRDEIVFTSARHQVLEEMLQSSLHIVDLQTKQIRDLLQDETGFENIKWAADGSKFAVTSALGQEKGNVFRKSDLFVIQRDGSNKTNISENQPWDVRDYAWLPDMNGFVVIGNSGVRSQVYRLSMNGESGQLSSGDAVYSDLSINEDGDRICFLRSDANQLPELFYSALQLFSEQKLYSTNSNLGDITPGRTDIIHWNSTDGLGIEGLLVKPPNYEAGLHYPLIVIPHGGPAGNYTLQFHSLAQLFATNGYMVFLPNVRGSTGYGEEFLHANIGDLGGMDFQDLMSGIDFLIKNGSVDADRLGIWGWSYGGYLSAWTVTQTDRFKAAVVGAGVTNWFSVYGQDQIQFDINEYFVGNPYKNTKLIEERSPIFHAGKVETPTLLLHGEKDVIDPLPQAKNFYLALREQKVPVELVVYPREGHSIHEPMHQKDLYQRSLEWMNKYLSVKISATEKQ